MSEIVTIGLIVMTIAVLAVLGVVAVRLTGNVLSAGEELETEEHQDPGRAAP